ncbi:MAG: hypothetical protein ACE5HX_18830 [bacterium]
MVNRPARGGNQNIWDSGHSLMGLGPRDLNPKYLVTFTETI